MKGPLKLVFVTGLAALASCQHKETVMSAKDIKMKADSVVRTRMEELNRQAVEDLDKRRSIEVKTKADSIVDAYIKANPIPTPVEE